MNLFLQKERNKDKTETNTVYLRVTGKSHGWRSLVGCSPWRH